MIRTYKCTKRMNENVCKSSHRNAAFAAWSDSFLEVHHAYDRLAITEQLLRVPLRGPLVTTSIKRMLDIDLSVVTQEVRDIFSANEVNPSSNSFDQFCLQLTVTFE
ncbi:hypothetical protein Tcan_01035, partial [Toxocara canis]